MNNVDKIIQQNLHIESTHEKTLNLSPNKSVYIVKSQGGNVCVTADKTMANLITKLPKLVQIAEMFIDHMSADSLPYQITEKVLNEINNQHTTSH